MLCGAERKEGNHLTYRRWGCRGKMAPGLIKTSTSQAEKQAAGAPEDLGTLGLDQRVKHLMRLETLSLCLLWSRRPGHRSHTEEAGA